MHWPLPLHGSQALRAKAVVGSLLASGIAGPLRIATQERYRSDVRRNLVTCRGGARETRFLTRGLGLTPALGRAIERVDDGRHVALHHPDVSLAWTPWWSQ